VAITNTRELFLHELSEIYDAEHRFVEGQQQMAQKATDGKLESAIRVHLEQTRLHRRNLADVFEKLGQEPRRELNMVAQGLVHDAQEGIQEAQGDALRDCVINTAVIKVEHFEIGSYRGLLAGARLMGQNEIVELLEQNLHQEEETAQVAEQSAQELLQKAIQAEEQEEGLIDKAKEKLMGQ
jgi:ferritin-like metal-binding protein YciE